MRNDIGKWIGIGLLALAAACSPTETPDLDEVDPLAAAEPDDGRRLAPPAFEIGDEIIEVPGGPNPDREAFFGDLHVHTVYSFDAYAFGTTATPYDAYRYAKGDSLLHPGGFNVKLKEPLDFYAVTDHAMFLGVMRAAADTSTEFSKLPVAEPFHGLNDPDNLGIVSMPNRLRSFATFIPNMLGGLADGSIDRQLTTGITKSAWKDSIEAAEQFNEPGVFTTFVAYEYTSSSDDRGNLHRNVIFKDSAKLPAVPFSRFHSQNPEGLWDWMDGLRDQGIDAIAIPHNSNGSNGQMFKMVDWAGNPMDDDYAEQRMRNEPLVEITQVKGTSETHPSLSDADEWADFEIMPYRVATMVASEPAGSYVRDALRRGLSHEERGTKNPYKFGFVGASDTHTGATSDDETSFHSKLGVLDSTSELRGTTPLPWWQALAMKQVRDDLVEEVGGESYMRGPTPTFGASGLAAVWAEENTRASIYDAFRRKETFATSGPRIRVRFFAGFDYDEDVLDAHDVVAKAYEGGVTMGADLAARGIDAPKFLAWAARDPKGGPLQRLQIVKGWSDKEGTHELVFDVACSDGLKPDPKTRRCPSNGASVDLETCVPSTGSGADQLQALWRDPYFDPRQRAFYYVRVLENPVCRWSTWDANRAGVAPRPDLKTTIQERAWSSPIWFVPQGTEATASTGSSGSTDS